MTLYCSKDVKSFKNSMLDVNDILRGWELKLGFSIFHIFNVNALKILENETQLVIFFLKK